MQCRHLLIVNLCSAFNSVCMNEFIDNLRSYESTVAYFGQLVSDCGG